MPHNTCKVHAVSVDSDDSCTEGIQLKALWSGFRAKEKMNTKDESHEGAREYPSNRRWSQIIFGWYNKAEGNESDKKGSTTHLRRATLT